MESVSPPPPLLEDSEPRSVPAMAAPLLSATASLPSSQPVPRTGLLNYYAPYLLGVFLCVLFGLTAWFPQFWWLWLLCQAGLVSAVYRAALRRSDFMMGWLPAIVVCILGQLHFLVLNGTIMRVMNAAIVSFGIAAHLRGTVRAYIFPVQYITSYRLFIAMFLAALSVYTVMAVAAAAVMLLQFPMGGAAGVVWLVTLLMTSQVMALTAHAQKEKSNASWLMACMIAELAAVLLFLPTLPFVAAALALTVYAPLLELTRTSFMLPSRPVVWWGSSGIVAMWGIVLVTARWP